MAIRELSPNKWQIDIYALDKTRRRYTVHGTYEQAAAAEKAAMIKLGKTRDTDPQLADLKIPYLEHCENQKAYTDKKNIVKMLIVEFGHLKLSQLNSYLIERYQTKLLKTLKPATVNRRISVLKHMISKAADWNMIGDTVVREVKKVKMKKENNARLRYLSKEEANKLLKQFDDYRAKHLKPIVVVALNTGMRLGEIVGLKWENIDLQNNFILLDDTKSGKRREIPINDTVRRELKQVVRRVDLPWVFLHNGKRIGSVKKGFEAACKRAGIYNLHFHDLRHTFASWLVMAGVDLATVKELLGHSSVNMTMRYAHLAPAHKVEALKLLDRLSGGHSQHSQYVSDGE